MERCLWRGGVSQLRPAQLRAQPRPGGPRGGSRVWRRGPPDSSVMGALGGGELAGEDFCASSFYWSGLLGLAFSLSAECWILPIINLSDTRFDRRCAQLLSSTQENHNGLKY
eukprot:scaffold164106_cov14-Tisochrysis_lutea.AAC.1